ncbi:MAG: hypothetical protein Q8L37_03780 [Candidatus Gottesmanbacteria bacterium]|nr:hypothetical protein [Candidatus Gottesmanbacteria bacterium]
MVEVTEGKPVNWTPAMEQTPAQQALRDKVSASLLARVQAPLKRATLSVKEAGRELGQIMHRVKKGEESLDEAERARTYFEHRKDVKKRKAAMVQLNMQGLDREARPEPNRYDRARGLDVTTVPPERWFHGGLADRTFHVAEMDLGAAPESSDRLALLRVVDVANKETRIVHNDAVVYWNPAVGEERVFPRYDLIIHKGKRGTIACDPKTMLASAIMTDDQYTSFTENRIFPHNKLILRIGQGNSITDEASREAVQEALGLLRTTKRDPMYADDLKGMTGVLESCLQAIPTP